MIVMTLYQRGRGVTEEARVKGKDNKKDEVRYFWSVLICTLELKLLDCVIQ